MQYTVGLHVPGGVARLTCTLQVGEPEQPEPADIVGLLTKARLQLEHEALRVTRSEAGAEQARVRLRRRGRRGGMTAPEGAAEGEDGGGKRRRRPSDEEPPPHLRMSRKERALRVLVPAERICEVRERRLQWHVVRVDAVAEREWVPDESTADRTLCDVGAAAPGREWQHDKIPAERTPCEGDDVVLEPASVRPPGEIPAEDAEPVALA